MKQIRLAEQNIPERADGLKVKELLALPQLMVRNLILDPGEKTPPHQVPVDMVFYVRTGSGYLSADGERAAVQAGDLIHIPSQASRSLEAAEGAGMDLLVFRLEAGDKNQQ